MTPEAAMIARVGIPWPPGDVSLPSAWLPLVERALVAMLARGWDGRLAQIKIKLGGLRIYTARVVPAVIDDVIVAAEAEAARTCEDCGAEATLRNLSGWLRTLCDECHARLPDDT